MPPSLPKNPRVLPLDGARALAMALVLSLHCLLSFLETPIGWAIQDRSKHIAADFFVWLGRAFLMPVFFLLSGFFSRQTVEGRGLRFFFVGRALTVLLPLLIALLPVSFAMNALWDFGRELAFRDAVAPQVPALHASELPVTLAHLWYLYYLLVLSTLTPLLPRKKLRVKGLLLPSLAAIPIALLLFAQGKLQLDTPLSFFVDPWIAGYFAVFFAWGWLMDREDLDLYARRLPWLLGISALLLASVVPALIASTAPIAGARAPAFALVASGAFTCAAVASFLGACGRMFEQKNSLVRYLADASYWTYVVHLPLVVFLQIQFAPLRVWGPLKYMAIVALTTGASLITWKLFSIALQGFRAALQRSGGTRAPRSRGSEP
jgi:glucan biosynthesis protein C